MDWNRFTIHFTVSGEGTLFRAEANNECVLLGCFENGCLDIAIKYDFLNNPPLHLCAAAKLGDLVQIHIRPYRLELYVNGTLADEEWPCGEHYLKDCPISDTGCGLCILPLSDDPKEEPSVLGTFQNAEGWKPEENVFVGDCMPFSHNGVYHVLYLKDRHHHKSKWSKGAHQWSHISTDDLVNWKIHPMAVEIDNPSEGSICTGSWIYDGELHYLFYTVRMCDGNPAAICRSTSRDGYHFTKDRAFSFILSEKYTGASARDPKIIKAADGIFHMILTTSLKSTGQGCLAHLISGDLTHWQELDSPLYISPDGMGEPECPDYFYKDGFYYLVCSLHGKAHYQYSTQPFSQWQLPENPIIPCETVPKAAVWQDRLIFTGFNGNGGYAGTMTFLEAVVQPDGSLKYQTLPK